MIIDQGVDVSQFTITCPEAVINLHALNNHTPEYFLSVYDENMNIVDIPVQHEQGLVAMKEIPCDDQGRVSCNMTLPKGFYYVKLFTKKSYQYCILDQSIQHTVIT
jgi:hypothetical protein